MERTLLFIADAARQVPEARSIETYAGTPAPFNFKGSVRHYHIREAPELGELHLNLAARGDRTRSSHAIAVDLRSPPSSSRPPSGTVARVVEVPPCRPVLATLLPEPYGPDLATRRGNRRDLKNIFASVPDVVDIDDSIGRRQPRLRLPIDQDLLDFLASNSAT